MGIVAKNLHKQFGETQVIRGVSLSVDRGEMVSLLGPSGGGKSRVASSDHLWSGRKSSLLMATALLDMAE